ncbi:hypothetical protein B0A54_00921 [Friedmanniomyces endolithicus]|uniref:Uncharacterized protein n=1 Tax=Friedmanniomyces endolithicus TaxID=329885 RepID=A0A4U0VKD8_9PEZI|nr:hypothetical protein B0A54_00921 [Friedmanniomyces endolithicus]
MTPIKVRGKRGAVSAQKWHAGKKRPVNRDASPAPKPNSSVIPQASVQLSEASSRKRKRRRPELSEFEQLPVEILQDIFVYCANLDLPLASSALMSKLSSRHMYLRLTKCAVQPVLGFEYKEMPCAAQLAAATRLFGCRFMTWDFFRAWLDEDVPFTRPRKTDDYWNAWTSLKPSKFFLPPAKLLHGHWTTEKANLLSIFLPEPPTPSPPLTSVLLELAHAGAAQAIAERAHVALRLLLKMGVHPTTEMLRFAVIDHGCDRRLVEMLFDSVYPEEKVAVDIDPLDPALWAWAEKAYERGCAQDGESVLDALKSLAWRLGRPVNLSLQNRLTLQNRQ